MVMSLIYTCMLIYACSVIHDKYEPDSPLLSPGGLMAAGLGAGLVAGGLTTPFDVSDPSGLWTWSTYIS
jgi:hypothetical protein